MTSSDTAKWLGNRPLADPLTGTSTRPAHRPARTNEQYERTNEEPVAKSALPVTNRARGKSTP